ncbi:MAG TPA: hypothetical protein VEH06_08810 [Candidatus Bathyarchaeia archaeon]|nr:hypothetical protein [Candidatus Bathyarchaeia archaeon]
MNQRLKSDVKYAYSIVKLVEETFGKHAIIQDPDGYLISLAEMKPADEFTQIPYYHGFASA